MTDFPEPTSFNGGPDETGNFAPTGRREALPVADVRGTPCHACDRPIHRVYTLAGVGAFCSPGCRVKATDPNWQRRTA
jgi:hypothetical protein